MSSQAPASTIDCKTCTSNADKHLGLPDVPKKRRSPAEKKADEQKLTDLRSEKEAAVARVIQQMGAMEGKMAGNQAAATAAAKPIRPHAKTTKNIPKLMKGEYVV